MNLPALLALARANLGGAMESSARLCMSDAVDASDRGDFDAAASWAIKSLSYSVGIFHPAYERAAHYFRTDAHVTFRDGSRTTAFLES